MVRGEDESLLSVEPSVAAAFAVVGVAIVLVELLVFEEEVVIVESRVVGDTSVLAETELSVADAVDSTTGSVRSYPGSH